MLGAVAYVYQRFLESGKELKVRDVAKIVAGVMGLESGKELKVIVILRSDVALRVKGLWNPARN